jgi:hypothetical protein
VVFALLVATAGPIATAVQSGTPGSTAGADQTESVDAAQNESPTSNDSTDDRRPVAHRKPSEVSDESNLSDVESWLASEMVRQLGDSVDASQQNRERAREIIGNDSEYARLAEQYAEVSGENRNESDAENAARFTDLGTIQREFFADVQRYRVTHRQYRNVTERNGTLRTRRLAHELERRTSAVNRTATRLNQIYANLSSPQRDQLDNLTQSIGAIRANVTRTQMAVRNRTLVRTRLSVRAVDSTASFADPAVLAGRLRTADGAPVADENVTLRIGNRTVNATTDRQGRLRVRYRPTLAAAGTRPRTVSFRPANESVYLGSDATVRLQVRQSTPSVRVSNVTETARYDETLVVNGTVGAEGVGAPDVPLVVSVGDVRLGQTRTGPNGSFRVESRLPATVSAGRQDVRVRLALENATASAEGPVALAPTNATASVTVEPTPTELSLTEVATAEESVVVSGRLTAAGVGGVGNRTVALQLGGSVVGTTTTNATGHFAASTSVPSRLLDGSSVRVGVVHRSSENLEAARTNATVTFPSSGRTISNRYLWFAVAGLLGLAIIGVAVWRFRSDDERAFDEGSAGALADADTPVATDRSPEELLDAARSELADDRFDSAAVAAYAAVRNQLDGDGAASEPRTHWEFYRARRDADAADERLSRLKRLTQTCERAAFAAEPIGEDDAAEVVASAESVLTASSDPVEA